MEHRLTAGEHGRHPRAAVTIADRITGGPRAARHDAPARRVCCCATEKRRCAASVIRTNLSTRPFYNERAVHLWLLIVARHRRSPRRS